jgi:hypothetical protein
MAGGSFGGGDGSSGNPYLVEDDLDLNAVRNNLSSFFLQTADINLSDNYSGGWTSIGTNDTRFTGRYDGQNYTIKNLKGVGALIGFATNSSARSIFANIFLENVDISSTTVRTAGLCGVLSSSSTTVGQIVNCHVSGKITSTQEETGGLIGIISLSASVSQLILYCSTNVNITGTTRVGGIVGNFRLNLTTESASSIEDCISTCEIIGTSAVGGIVGYSLGAGSSTTNAVLTYNRCISSGNVKGVSDVGGILGLAEQTTRHRVVISNCVSLHDSITRTSGTNTNFGRICARSSYSINLLTLTNNRALDTMKFVP